MQEPDWLRSLRTADMGDLFVAGCVVLAWLMIVVLALLGAF